MKANIRFKAVLGLYVVGAAFTGLCTPAYAWTDGNPSGASQCAAVDINDAGTVIANCEVNNTAVTYVTVAGTETQLSALPSTPGGVPCASQAINNAVAGTETIIGACQDGNEVWQAVSWVAGSPASPRQLMPYPGTLGILDPGVRTSAADVNAQGITVGVSVDGNDIALPVYWSGSGTATPFNTALLAPLANCAPASINDAATPSVVGNCPAGSSGKSVAVLWPTLSSSYASLPVPSGASYCAASQINLSGQILGECIYGTDTRRAVQWGPGGTGPAVLMTVNGGTILHTTRIAQNDSGVVAVSFLAGGSLAGFSEPAVWNPAGGNTNASGLTLPSGAIHGGIGAIGNNGKMVGNFETWAGDTHPMHVESGSSTVVDDGSPEGGPNAVVTALSKSGTKEAGVGESGAENAQAIYQSVP
ncbi:hypothetical protein [Burkholderia alba]|uniref:hypothetical protein n=1 Tax=Burkholderia alba TaxID=2683677 RepID=UPI002B058B3F|nr:hypothetical protein [Burkholderia alba]